MSEDPVDRKMKRVERQMVERLTSHPVSDTTLNLLDAENLVKALNPVLRPLLQEYDEAIEAISNLRGKLTEQDRAFDRSRKQRNLVAEQERLKAQGYLCTLIEQKVQVLKAELDVEEVNAVLRRAGAYPPGPQGVSDLADDHRTARRQADARVDLLSRIADIEGRENPDGPGEPIDFKDAMLRLDQIREVIKEWDDDERYA